MTVAFIAMVLSGIGSRAVAETAQPEPVLEVFTRPGCSHCARAVEYLDDLRARHPALRLDVHDVVNEPGARDRLRNLAARNGVMTAVPTFVVGEHVLVGFDDASTTGRTIERWLDEAGAAPETVKIPLVGDVSVRKLGLPLFSIVLGLVDGFNPCAMWVLLFLLSLLINLHSRRRMALIGGTFVVVSGVAYYAFMTAWLGVFIFVGMSRWLEAVLGLVAIAAGSIHLKDAIAPHHGLSLSIPERAKPGIYARVRSIVYAENMTAALAATIALAVVVNLIELACTAGLPALFTQILAAHGLSWWQHQLYVLLYIVAYMLDDTLMLALAVITLSRRKVQERAGRVMKLVSGAVMVALGVLLIASPQWLRFT